jgi:hypothetical protein
MSFFFNINCLFYRQSIFLYVRKSNKNKNAYFERQVLQLDYKPCRENAIYTIMRVASITFYWLSVFYKITRRGSLRNLNFLAFDLDLIFNNKRACIHTITLNKVCIKLNCASNGLKIIAYIFQPRDFSYEEPNFLFFLKTIVTRMFNIKKIYLEIQLYIFKCIKFNLLMNSVSKALS